jgi:hypothetical protein
MHNNGSFKSWITYVQISIPVLVFGLGVYVNQVNSNIGSVKEQIKTYKQDTDLKFCQYSTEIKDFNDKVFKHMTNDEIHTPKSITISKAEFQIYQEFRGREISDLKNLVVENNKEIKNSIDKLETLIEKKNK